LFKKQQKKTIFFIFVILFSNAESSPMNVEILEVEITKLNETIGESQLHIEMLKR
jgi:hypothetical protein